MVSITSVLPTDEHIDEDGVETWLQSIAGHRDEQEIKDLREACQQAMRLHGDQRQPSGELTMLHLLHVADILDGLAMDVETMVAALLHDAMEHAGFNFDNVARRFGDTVAGMLKDMARIGMVASQGGSHKEPADRHAENLRRMLLGIADDVRVVLVVLAERLQVMRTLKHLPREDQLRIARETRDIYAPLANRLGVWQLKWELEDLSLRYLEPDSYKDLAGKLDGRRRDREQFIGEVIDILQERCAAMNIRAEITGRPKHIYSIWRKMSRKGVAFEQIFDVLAVRVLVDTVAQCYEVLGIVHSLWKHIPGEFDDYIATPKSNMYQSLHTAVVGPEGKPLEVQVRTIDMHDHAERGVAAHWRYKESRGHDPELERRIEWMRQWLELKDDDNEDIIDKIKFEFESEQIYVLTPQGQVIELPRGSTPVDFAYAVHTSVGHRCRGAKVDGRIVPLTHRLDSGDRVEILTVKEGGPSRDWLSSHLNYLKTSRARNRVRQWFKQQDHDQHVHIGRSSLDREVNRLGVERPDLDKLAPRFNLKSGEDLLAAIGRGDVSPVQVAGSCLRRQVELPLDIPPLAKRRSRRQKPGKGQSEIMVAGVGDLMTQMAKCCKPVPPDQIVGYITRGHGVTVHRKDCSVVRHLKGDDRARLIPVSWGEEHEGDSYPVDILVVAGDRKGLLRDITGVLANEEVDVTAVKTQSNQRTDEANMRFTIEIHNMQQLSRVVDKLAQLPDVLEVRRQV